jgi:HrpA-like RNA helicase
MIVPQVEERNDGSVVDLYGNKIGLEDRLRMIETVENIPATLLKSEIADMVNDNIVSIIQWETWSGKTTQVWKVIHLWTWMNVITTVPRVISAISVSDRVSQELLCETWNPYYTLGQGVGYRTWDYKNALATTPLAFHTDGTELMRLTMSWSNPDVLILDEIHNYAIPTEILAHVVREKIKNTKGETRIVLMSATLNPAILQEYFKSISTGIPVLSIQWRTFPITKYYNNWENPTQTVASNALQGNHVLLFCNGKSQINDYIDSISYQLSWQWDGKMRFDVRALHAELPADEQMEIMKTPQKWTYRIIVSTNVAEESITIPYINTVVDLWTEKTVNYDIRGLPHLDTQNISKANAKQRWWRAWRVQNWTYIRENSSDYDSLREYPIAPIENNMLDREILLLISYWKDVRKTYTNSQENWESMFIHSIDENLLDLSYHRLKQIWALDHNSKITLLWKEILKYPMTVQNARIFIESLSRGCSKQALTMVAILEKNGFISQEWRWRNIKLSQKKEGDIFAMYSLYKKMSVSVWDVSDDFLNQLSSEWCNIDNLIELKKQSKNAKGSERKKCERVEQTTQLFEIIDMSVLWINTKRLTQIHTMISWLEQRLQNVGVDLEEWKSVNQIKNSLLSGNLHNIFDFWKTKNGRYNVFHAKNYPDSDFIAGKFSWIVWREGQKYIAIPFVIWWDENQDDLGVLTSITPIDQTHISEFHRQILWTYDLQWEGWDAKVNFREVKLTTWSDSIDDFNQKLESTDFETEEDAKVFFLMNIVPEILLESNRYVKNYINNHKLDLDKWIFRELLKKVLKTEISRVNLNNLEKSKVSFTHDTTVLDRFKESKDPIIRSFLAWKTIHSEQLYTKNNQNIPVLWERETIPHELMNVKKKYAKLVWRSWQEIDIDTFYERELEVFFTQNVDYKPITKFLDEQADITTSDIRLIKTISNASSHNAKRKERKNTIWNLISYINWAISWKNNKVIDMTLFQDLDSEDLTTLRRSINQSKSSKNRISKKWRQHLEEFSINLEAQLKTISSRESYTLSQIEENNDSIWIQLYYHLLDFCKIYFDEDYIKVIKLKLLYTAKEILQQQKSWDDCLKTIMKELFSKENSIHLKEKSKKFQNLEILDDLTYELEVLQTSAYDEVKETQDMDTVNDRVEEYTEKLEKFYKLKSDILSDNHNYKG